MTVAVADDNHRPLMLPTRAKLEGDLCMSKQDAEGGNDFMAVTRRAGV